MMAATVGKAGIPGGKMTGSEEVRVVVGQRVVSNENWEGSAVGLEQERRMSGKPVVW